MRYAVIKDSKIEKLIPRPKWFTSAGEDITDEELSQHGIVPVYETPPQSVLGKRFVVKPLAAWTVHSDRVEVTYDIISVPFHELRDEALARINAEYSKRTAMLSAGYPEDEQKSWILQANEAAIVLGADDQPTPWIDASAAKEGVTRENLAMRIHAMDSAYRVVHGKLSAIRRMLRDQIMAVPNDENAAYAFAAIQWPDEEEESED